MKRIVECVPNFSEGRDAATLDAIGAAVRSVAGAKLLGLEPDKDYHRCVVTFVGEPAPVLEAAVAATRAAAERIDMTKHAGEHPRIGAADVVPFIPVSGVTMEECVALARQYGKRIWDELKIPVYFYEAAATTAARRNLSDIRKGEYEGLAAKLRDPAWKPDVGEPEFNPRSGATVTGARKFLIAYNVNLSTPNAALAQEIAQRIRESGRPMKDRYGKPVKNEQGEAIRIPGTLKAVKAMGVYLERHKIAQVSMNLVDFEQTPPHRAFEEVRSQARALDIDVTGSEIVGLTPLTALTAAGRFYAGEHDGLTDEQLVSLAVERLGLNQLDRFEPEKKIIEYQI